MATVTLLLGYQYNSIDEIELDLKKTLCPTYSRFFTTDTDFTNLEYIINNLDSEDINLTTNQKDTIQTEYNNFLTIKDELQPYIYNSDSYYYIGIRYITTSNSDNEISIKDFGYNSGNYDNNASSENLKKIISNLNKNIAPKVYLIQIN